MTQICRPKKINSSLLRSNFAHLHILSTNLCNHTSDKLIRRFSLPLTFSHMKKKKERKKEKNSTVDFLMFITLISKYKPDSDLATVIDDSSSLPPSSPRNDRECSPKIIVIDSPWFRYASDGRHESLLESRWLAGWYPFGETGITPRRFGWLVHDVVAH